MTKTFVRISLGVTLLFGLVLTPVQAVETQTIPSIQNPFQKTAIAQTQPILSEEARMRLKEKELVKDNLREFEQKRLQEVRTEIQTKKQLILEQRRSCQAKLVNFVKERAQSRRQLVASCLPKKPTTPPATTAEAKALREEQVQQLQACREQYTQFDKETRQGKLNIREECFNTERQVLGLQTEVPN